MAQLELNLTQAALVPPASSTIAFEGIGIDTFLLDKDGVDISSTKTDSLYTNVYLTGDIVTHAIAGSSRPVTTASNGTILPNSTVIDTVGETISFNVTGNMGDIVWLYTDLPKLVINVTDDDITRWNVTVNGANVFPDITQNATDTSTFGFITLTENATVEVEGDNIIPELSSMLIILIITSCIAIATAKNRTKKKL